MKKILLLIISLTLNTMLSAKEIAPTEYNSFDGVLPGGRALAMGYAFCAVGNDPSTAFYNPAGLQGLQENYLNFTYEVTRQSTLSTEQIFKGESLNGANLCFISLVSSKGAFSWRPLSNKIIRVNTANGWQENEIKMNQYMFSVSANNENYLSGLNISYLNGRIGQAKVENGVPSVNISDGDGVSCDFGLMFNPGSIFKIGINFQNLLGYMWWDDFETQQLPFVLRTGITFNITNFLVFATDWEKRYYKDSIGPVEVTHYGLEQSIGKVLKLQIGMYGENLNDSQKLHNTAGISYQQNNYLLSIAGEKYKIGTDEILRYLFAINMPI